MGLMGGSEDGNALRGSKSRAGSERRRSNGSRQSATGEPSDDPLDPMLEVKKRARRRLIGAIALVIAAIVFVPMVFDSGQTPTTRDVVMEVPPRDSEFPAPGPRPPPAAQDRQTASGVVQREGPPSATGADGTAGGGDQTSPSPETSKAGANVPEAVTHVSPAAEPSTAKAAEKSAEKPNAKDKVGTTVPPSKPAPREGERALAALEGKSPDAVGPDRAKPPADATVNGKAESFVVQIGAFSDPAKVESLKNKLAGSNFKTYTEPTKTSKGDLTRLLVGPYTTRDAAEKAQERIRKLFVIDAKVVPL